ncbi:MAG: hypothetical protein R3205_12080, partial [Psychrobacter sp.]|nr:hypothetical protein [Psychrobacter sp.]
HKQANHPQGKYTTDPEDCPFFYAIHTCLTGSSLLFNHCSSACIITTLQGFSLQIKPPSIRHSPSGCRNFYLAAAAAVVAPTHAFYGADN